MDSAAHPGLDVERLQMGKAPHYSGAGKDENARLRTVRALELRLAGLTYAEIAEMLGFAGKQGAHEAVQRAMHQETEHSSEQRDQYREIELARLERLLLKIWPRALSGDLRAIDRVLKIMERECRLLGLDAPTAVALTDETRDRLTDVLDGLAEALGVADDAPSAQGSR